MKGSNKINFLKLLKMQHTDLPFKSSFQPPVKEEQPERLSLPPFDAYHKYLQNFSSAYHLQQQAKMLGNLHKFLVDRLRRIEVALRKHQEKEQESDSLSKSRPKRPRRLAIQISKPFLCQQERCQKTYGTLGSLQQHQRLKHPELFTVRSTRDKLPSIQDFSSQQKNEVPQQKVIIH